MFKKSNLKIHPTKQIKSPVKNEIYFMKIYSKNDAKGNQAGVSSWK